MFLWGSLALDFAGCSTIHPTTELASLHVDVMQDFSATSDHIPKLCLYAPHSLVACPSRTLMHLSLPSVAMNSAAQRRLLRMTLYFSQGSAQLDDVERQKFSRVAGIYPWQNFRMEVSTDTLGTALQNEKVAQERMQTVLQQLLLRHVNAVPEVVWHTRCCFGSPGIAVPMEQDRYVQLDVFKSDNQGNNQGGVTP